MSGFLAKKPKNVISAEDAKKISKEIETREVISNIAVFSMPARFRNQTGSVAGSRKIGAIVVILGIFFLIGLAGAFYWFGIKKNDLPFFNFGSGSQIQPSGRQYNQETNNENEIENPGTATSTADEPANQPENTNEDKTLIEQAEEIYISFKKTQRTVRDFAGFASAAADYGTAGFVEKIQAMKTDFDQLSEAQKESFIGLIRAEEPDLSAIESGLASEIIPGGRAKITVSSSSPPAWVELAGEGGQWKVSSEYGFYAIDPDDGEKIELSGWLKKAFLKASSTVPGIKASDQDADGLTDQEEIALGSNPALADSDNDGYSDQSELKALFNPAGAGDLSKNPVIKKYSSLAFKYSFLYPAPAGWELQNAGDDLSLVLKTDDNQFFQVIVQENLAKESIESWYKKQFAAFAVSADKMAVKRVQSSDSLVWEGVFSEDENSLYFTNSAKNLIITATYSHGTSGVISYPEIFRMIVGSFEFN